MTGTGSGVGFAADTGCWFEVEPDVAGVLSVVLPVVLPAMGEDVGVATEGVLAELATDVDSNAAVVCCAPFADVVVEVASPEPPPPQAERINVRASREG